MFMTTIGVGVIGTITGMEVTGDGDGILGTDPVGAGVGTIGTDQLGMLVGAGDGILGTIGTDRVGEVIMATTIGEVITMVEDVVLLTVPTMETA